MIQEKRVKLDNSREDSWMWKDKGTKVYIVKSAYKKLQLKTQCFVWRMLLNRIPTQEHVTRKGASVDNTLCVMCSDSKKSVSHLFYECKVAMKVLNIFP